MKRNSIFLRSKLSEKELALLKFDLINNVTYFASKIKHLDISRNIIEEMATNAVEQVLSNYKFGQDGSLGDLVKSTVIANLRAYYEKAYPDQADKILWPDLDKRAPFEKLLDVLEKVNLLSKSVKWDIFNKVNEGLSTRQKQILCAIYGNPFLTYAEISKMFGKRGVMTYREIAIIYKQLIQVLKDLEVIL